MRLLALLLIFFALFFGSFLRVEADELDDITKELSVLNEQLKSKEGNFTKLKSQLEGVRSRVRFIEGEIVKKSEEVRVGEKNLIQQKKLLNERARLYYKNIGKNSGSILNLLVSNDFSTSLQNFFYQKTIVDEDKNTIVRIVLYVKGLEEKREQLKIEQKQLAVVNGEIDRQSTLLSSEISGTRQKIAQLSAQQQSLLAQKLASLNIPRSAGTSARGCSSDLDNGRDPGFSPKFGFFTFGAPHRNGLNQYGAWGRAKAGQNEEQILQEYYPGLALKKDYDQNTQIAVDGNGSFSIEDYVKRIYEVPDSWTDNNSAVLKAQAVAARTYALNSMQRNGHICTTEACQVFKPEPKGGNWEQAVNATAGWVLMDGGSPGFTQYASTHGGYVLNLSKFDGSGGNPSTFEDLKSRAYDKESPWFYCNWGSRSAYGGTAWLKSTEVADIINAILLAKRDASVQEHLYQTDSSNPSGAETWDAEKVKNELKARGGNPYSSVSDVGISWDNGSGRTTTVTMQGDGGSQSVGAAEFKDYFNLRAPANIQIVGPLFNVEKR